MLCWLVLRHDGAHPRVCAAGHPLEVGAAGRMTAEADVLHVIRARAFELSLNVLVLACRCSSVKANQTSSGLWIPLRFLCQALGGPVSSLAALCILGRGRLAQLTRLRLLIQFVTLRADLLLFAVG